MTSQQRHPSELALDELVAGVTTDRARAAVSHLEECTRCSERVAMLRRSNDEFLQRFPAAKDLPRRAVIELGQANAGVRAWRRWLWPMGAAALAAALFAVVLIPAVNDETTDAGVRVKGGSIVDVAVARDGNFSPFSDQRLREGDRLAFRYTTTKRFLMVVSLEASGRVFVVLPAEGSASMPIDPGVRRRLENGVQLDDYPGAERLIALLSDTPLDAAEVQKRVTDAYNGLMAPERETLEIPDLGLGADQLSWLVRKESR